MKKNPSVNELLWHEYTRIPFAERPRIGTSEWTAWLAKFRARYPEKVGRMTEDLESRAYAELRHGMPGE